jgi:hypothetical protein
VEQTPLRLPSTSRKIIYSSPQAITLMKGSLVVASNTDADNHPLSKHIMSQNHGREDDLSSSKGNTNKLDKDGSPNPNEFFSPNKYVDYSM